jgi:hypothetical protein
MFRGSPTYRLVIGSAATAGIHAHLDLWPKPASQAVADFFRSYSKVMPEDLMAIEEHVTSLLKEVAESLPHGKASINIKRAPQIQHEGVSISLVPASPTAASIVADARNGFPIISLVLGKSTLVEVLPDGKKPQLDEVHAICDAVIQGRFQEDLTLVGTEITKCVGRIDIDGREQIFRYFGRIFPFKKNERRHISYAPY